MAGTRQGGESDLEARVRFEAFFADLTSRFLTVPADELPREIECGLAGLVEILEVDRCGVALFSADQRGLPVRYSYARPGVDDLRGMDLAQHLPWWTEQLRRERRLAFSLVAEELPPEAEMERQFVLSNGIRSHAVLPLVIADETVGALGLASVSEPRPWPPELLVRLELLASVFAHAIYRHGAEERITAAEELNRAILRALPSEVSVLDGEGRIVAMNEAARRRAEAGGPCAVAAVKDGLSALVDAAGGDASAPSPVSDGVRSVLARRSPSFEAIYAQAGEQGTRHRLLHAMPLDERPLTVVVQTDVTELEETKSELHRRLCEIQELRDRLEAENVLLHGEVRHAHGFDTIVGRSAALGRVLAQVEQVAPTDSPVLLLGETGTGKDLVARALHDRSRRRERPLVTVNCAALPPTLIESELFGYERGAFTGALQRTIGRFEIADRSTIFLDEVGELPLDLQAKLLRVLQNGEFERLGSSRTVKADVRLIAATNRDLGREVREGRFRADLYYRLSVFPVSLPPLRDRPEDIPLLVWHFVSLKQARLGREIKRIPERLMRALTTYAWPGNVRELENVIERALILTEGHTLAADPSLFAGAREDRHAPGGDTLEDVQRAHIRAVLAECDWKVAGPGNAAERLGLNRSTLQFRMKKLGIERPGSEGAR